MKKLLIYAFIILCITSACNSDRKPKDASAPQSMAVASDLSNQRVMAFAEDSVGHIWIGTFRGLNKYNGHNYHQYFCIDSTIDLPDNQITDLFTDSRNRLWVATINGVAIFDNNHHFHRVDGMYPVDTHADQIFESAGHDKKIYVNFRDRLDVYDEAACSLRTAMPNLNPLGERSVHCHFDRRNKLWAVTPRLLRCFQPDNFSVIDSIALPSVAVSHYMDVDADRLWLGGDRYLAIYDLRNRKMLPLPTELAENPLIRKANITNIHPYEEGYWLLNTSNCGLIVYNSVNGRVWAEGDAGYPFDLPNFRITHFFTDSHKNLWVGSYNHGCAVINKYQRQFNSNTALNTFVNGRSINSVDHDSRGNIWITAGFDGLLIYNPSTGEAHTIDPHTISGDAAPNASITFAEATRDGSIWLASLLEHKVWRCTYADGRLNIIKEYEVPTPISIAEDDQGGIWIGSGQPYLLRYNPVSDSFVSCAIPHDPDKICFVSGIAPVGDKVYVSAYKRPLLEARWIGNDIAVDSLAIPDLPKAITRGGLIPTDLLYDSYGMLWIGTVGNGLLLYNPEDGSVKRIAGLPCTDVSALEEDKQGHIWISTQYGLARYDRTSGSVKCYYANDGIGGNQFYDRASTFLPDGTLVFGGTHGLTEFNPIDVGSKRKVPLVFEDLKVHNVIVDPLESPEIIAKNLAYGPKVILANDQNTFSISFAALDYASPEAPAYSYMLEGHDPYWIDARQNNEAYYSRLKPGDYTFRVRIADGSNSLVESEISLPVHIRGSLWHSWWAIALYALALALIVFAVYRHRRDIRQQQERMRQMLIAMEGMTAKKAAEQPTEVETEEPAPQQSLSETDAKFLQELQGLMEAELSNPELDINKLSEMMRISRTKLFYKVKAITGVNPSVFFKTYKLNRAAQLLKEGRHTVSEIAYMTGYSSAAHFSTSFKKQFGNPPTDFAK